MGAMTEGGEASTPKLPERPLAGLRVQFSGEVSKSWMSSRQRMESLRWLGADVTVLDTRAFVRNRGLMDKIVPRMLGLPTWPDIIAEWNEAALALRDQPAPAIAWFEWPRYARVRTLEALREAWPQATFVCFQDDNPFGLRRERRNWKLFHEVISFWDVHLVKRNRDIENFRKAGARDVRLFQSGYFEPLFEIDEPPSPSHDVVFIGTALDRRVPFIEELVFEHGIDVRVFGLGGKWERSRLAKIRPDLLGPQLFDESYVRALRDHRICLAFVSHSNQDEYSMRTFEIPATGSFMLAERTPMHQRFFREGEEVEFFGSVAECAEKIRRYLADENGRREVAAQGAKRCRLAGYGLRHQVLAAVEDILDRG